MIMLPKTIGHVAIVITITALLGGLPHVSAQTTNVSKSSSGDPSCPCLTADDLAPINIFSTSTDAPLPVPPDLSGVSLSTYGIGCDTHDLNGNTKCLPENDCNAKVPQQSARCDLSWCKKSWCYVSPSNCRLYHEASAYYPDGNRYYSYATCGNMDRFVNNERINLLSGKMFQVGYCDNSGGWKGSYSPNGHFARSGWDGPIVEFFDRVAIEGGFSINRTKPPDSLIENSQDFFSNSAFDYCVYATALGYLDFCVGMFTITGERAAAASFFTVTSEPLYLYIFDSETQSWQSFWSNVSRVFVPFSRASWCIIFLFFLPIISVLLVYHEVETLPGYEKQTKCSHIFFLLGMSIYRVYFGFLSQAYDDEIVTLGGRLTSIGLSFFILTTLATYTANLAAIFTETERKMKIESIHDAINAGYTFCGSRNSVKYVMDIYGIEDRFVPDLEDGLPGFNCANCDARTRVFDFMKLNHNNPSLYCDAAIATSEDIEVMWSELRHCNKTSVGEPIIYIDRGIPISNAIQVQLTALLQDVKNRGIFDKLQRDYKPTSICPQVQETEMSLTVQQLSGIWVITATFLMAGIIVPFFTRRTFDARKKSRALRNKDGSRRQFARRFSAMPPSSLKSIRDNDDGADIRDDNILVQDNDNSASIRDDTLQGPKVYIPSMASKPQISLSMLRSISGVLSDRSCNSGFRSIDDKLSQSMSVQTLQDKNGQIEIRIDSRDDISCVSNM